MAPGAPVLDRGSFLPITKVAAQLGVSGKTVRRLMASGRFPRQQRVLGRWRIPQGDVAAFLAEEARQPEAKR
jgi:excisionase family DNA binding protein